DLSAAHELELPEELDALDAEALAGAAGRVEVYPHEGHLSVECHDLPAPPVDFRYVPMFAFAEGARDALGPHGEEGHGHEGLHWAMAAPALEEDEHGDMATMLMLGHEAAADLGALRNAAVLVVGAPELEPAPEPFLILEGELAVDEDASDVGEQGGGGAAEPAGHSHGP
ncbi:MAG: hypothetical protein IT382_07480, partial [Deltaproteobacteria bacterium]|nr:hypothetical protein [Deltaproteobacteria bacterium]